jgi:hypothetical protein
MVINWSYNLIIIIIIETNVMLMTILMTIQKLVMTIQKLVMTIQKIGNDNI